MAAALEPRLLLAFVVSGTAGPDLIEMFHDGTAYRIQVNGVSAGFTNDPEILVKALGGDDTIVAVNVKFGQRITIQGGAGDDTVRVGGGHAAAHLQGQVFVREFAGEGNDRILFDDTLDNADTEREFTVAADTLEGLTHRFTSGLGAPPTSVHFDGNVESIRMSASNADDEIHVLDGMPQGLSVSLGGGNDKVVYGGRFQVVPDLPPATIDGGEGFDDVVFNDRDGPAGGRVYDGGEGRFMNQNLTGFENLTLTPRQRVSGGEHEVVFRGGFPVGDNILIDTIFHFNTVERVRIGTFGERIDLDSQDLIFTLRSRGAVEIEDQDLDSTGAPFELWTSGSNTQRIDKGGFRLAWETPAPTANISSHSPTQYAVSRVHPDSRITISGSAGDDALYTADRNGHDNDIDAVFPFSDGDGRGSFFFQANQGDDLLDLDDSGDQTGDGDPNYFVVNDPAGENNVFRKGPGSDSINLPTLVEFSGVDRVNVVGDADGNVMNVRGQAGTRVTLNGGLGNDTLTNDRSLGGDLPGGDLHFDASGGALIGGPGIDSAALDDSRFAAIGLGATEYTFTPGSFSYAGGGPARTFAYDESLEFLSLNQSDNPASTTRLHGKLPALRLSVSALGGEDTFVVGGGDIEASGFSETTTTLLGGDGNDSIEFDDRFDAHSANEPEVYSLGFQEFRKDAVRIVYGSFEAQRLTTGGRNPSPLPVDNVVNVNGIDVPTTIVAGGAGRGDIVNVNWNQLFAPLTLDLAADEANTVNVNDQGSTANNHYRLTAAGLTAGFRALVYAGGGGVDRLNLFAGNGSDFVDVAGVPPGTRVFAHGGGGNDSLYVGDGRVADVRGSVSLDGGPGTDDVRLNNQNATTFADVIVTADSFSADGGPSHFYAGAEFFAVIHGAGGSRTEVRSAPAGVQLSVTGGPDNDLFVVGGGDLDANIPSDARVFFDGFSGTDRLEYDDRLDVNEHGGPDSYVLDANLIPFLGSFLRYERLIKRAGDGPRSTVEAWRVEERVLHASDDGTSFQVTDPGVGLRVNANGGDDEVYVTGTAAGSPVALDTGPGADLLDVDSDAGGTPATVLLDRSDGIRSLSVRAGGTLRVGPGAVLTAAAGGGAFLLDGVIDLAGGAIVVQNGAALLAGLTAHVKGGRNGGAWNGATSAGGALGTGAIHSSLAASTAVKDAVGLARASDLFGLAPATVLGQPVNPNDVVFRHTLEGDCNLDGWVTSADLLRLRKSLGRPNTRWDQGNFNYDAATNVLDVAALRRNFFRQVGIRFPSGGSPLT